MARLVRLSVLESYGVVWSRETLARDLLQNFFDATGDFRKLTLRVDREAREVEISGSDAFDLELLCYIGATTKQDGTTVGGFGEGFKVCALVATRDYGVRMTAGSGRERLEVVFEPVPLGRELCYRVEEAPQAEQAWVRLEGCDAQLMAAFERGPDQFRHPDHPGLQEPFVLSEDGKSGFYWAKSPREGMLFYRRQRRGAVRLYGLDRRGLTVVHDEVVEALEGDRDRRDLSADQLVRAVGHKLSEGQLWQVVDQLEGSWAYGDEVLTPLLEAARERGLKRAWPPKWVARGRRGEEHWEAMAKRQGYELAMASFHAVGMRRAEQLYSTDLVTRAPTAVEQARYDLLKETYRSWTSAYKADDRRLEVFALEGAAVQGQFMTDRVLIAQELLAGEFAPAAGTILHELAHEAGGEESPRFLRRLELLLFEALANQAQLVELEQRWASAGEAVAAPQAPPPAEEEPAAHPYNESLLTSFFGIYSDQHMAIMMCVPPGFLPARGLDEVLEEVVSAHGGHRHEAPWQVWWQGVEVSGPEALARVGAPGLPAYCVNGAWLEGEVVGEVEGCALLRYEGAYAPSWAMLEAHALAHPVARGEEAPDALGAMIDTTIAPREEEGEGEDESEARYDVRSYVKSEVFRRLIGAEPGQHWDKGVAAMAQVRAQARVGELGAGAGWEELSALAEQVVEEVMGWEREEERWGEALPDYDEGDPQDRWVLAMCRGAGLYVWRARGEGREAGQAMLEGVWGLWQGLLDVSLELEVKALLIEGALMRGGMCRLGGALALEAVKAQLEALREEALAADRRSYRSGAGSVARVLRRAWDAQIEELAQEPEYTRYMEARGAASRRRAEERQRRQREHAEDVSRTWEEALAASGGDERAGLEACVWRWWSVASEEVV